MHSASRRDTSRRGRTFEVVIMCVAVAVVIFRFVQWRHGMPDLNVVAIVALLLVPVAVRTQVTVSRGQTDLTLGATAAVLLASDPSRPTTILPIWAVLVAVSYVFFHRDESWGQFRAAVQILGGAALVRFAHVTDIGLRPYDRVAAGIIAYLAMITSLELLRRAIAPTADEGRALRLRWTWTFLLGLTLFYVGCLLGVLRQVVAGVSLPVVSSLVVALFGAAGIIVALWMRTIELSRGVAALSSAAVAMPWNGDDIDGNLKRWGSQGVRVEEVVVRAQMGSRWEYSVPLADGRFVVAQRSPGDLPFTQVEIHVIEALANMSDTARREFAQTEELRQRANTDGLTGLSTYTFFRSMLEDASASRLEGESIGIVFIDLDGFKEINDRYGHIAGDAAIRVLSERLREHVGDATAITRYGGDEFAVLVRGVRDYAHLTQECDRLTAVVTEPIVVGADTLRLRASAGVALSSSPRDSTEELVRVADQQMY